jgi:hypothetical protein
MIFNAKSFPSQVAVQHLCVYIARIEALTCGAFDLVLLARHFIFSTTTKSLGRAGA